MSDAPYAEEAPKRNALRCMYSCDECGVKRAGVDVPERGADQDVVEWVEKVAMYAIVADHNARSPKCKPKKLTEMFIPVEEGAKSVGFLPTEN